MICRCLVFSLIAIVTAIKPLYAWQDRAVDSLLHIVHANNSEDNNRKYDALCQLASISSNADTIIKYSEQALQLASKMGRSQARAYTYKGIGNLNSGRLAAALECFLNAAGEYEKFGSSTGLATAYTYISQTYSMQGNHGNERLYLKRAIELFTRENDTLNLASAMHNLGYSCFITGQYDSALVLFKKTGEIYQQLEYLTEYGYTLGNSGMVYSRLSEYDLAENHLLKAIEMLQLQGDEYAVAEYMIEYASVLQQKGKMPEALSYARTGFQKASANSILELERDAAYRLAQLYRVSGRYDSACHFLSLYISTNDSIKNIENIQKMADLRTGFEVAKKQAEVDVLQKNRIIQLIVIGSLGLILMLAGWLIIMYYRNLERLRKLAADLRERKTLLENQSTELRELNRIKDKFFSVVSHDLRGPISSIGGISHMIRDSMEHNNKALLHEITDYIDQTVFSLTGLLENLLNWAQSQQGRFPYNETEIDTKELVTEVVRLFSTIAVLKDIRINLKLHDNLCIVGDRNSMMMIIRNLVSNALKFTKANGMVSIATRLTGDGMAEIAVSDNGVGIPEDKLPWLFDFKENKSTYGTDKEKGVGLGLSLVHEFVKMNKGTIQVSSTVGKGTSFVMQFTSVK
ncbi:MAG: tetratricopeptide repeat-containing sensor histidine kinase [Bacteroidales bacterium]|nr:tetratricopeptide repeat-containing sensor histidine kinase [Bacteroidales bacterium]